MDKPTNNPFCRGVLQKWEVLRLRFNNWKAHHLAFQYACASRSPSLVQGVLGKKVKNQ